MARPPAQEPAKDALRCAVSHHDIPATRDDERGVRLLMLEDQFDRLSSGRQLRARPLSKKLTWRDDTSAASASSVGSSCAGSASAAAARRTNSRPQTFVRSMATGAISVARRSLWATDEFYLCPCRFDITSQVIDRARRPSHSAASASRDRIHEPQGICSAEYRSPCRPCSRRVFTREFCSFAKRFAAATDRRRELRARATIRNDVLRQNRVPRAWERAGRALSARLSAQRILVARRDRSAA